MSMHRSARRVSCLLVGLLSGAALGVGCGDDHSHGDPHSHDDHSHGDGGHEHDAHPNPQAGTPTTSTCPSTSTLTYENFGAPFMQMYCTRCHDSSLTGAARSGAPLGHDFDTREGILLVADHIDQYAAAGPDAVNTFMPIDGAEPTEDERTQLGEWLARDAP